MDCSNPSISLEEILKTLLRKDPTGLVGLGVKYFNSGYTQKAINCNTQDLSFEQLFRLCLGIDPDCGKLIIRIAELDSLGCLDAVDCNNSSSINPWREIFVYNPTTKTYAIALAQYA